MLKGCHQEPGFEVLHNLQALSSPRDSDGAEKKGKRFCKRQEGMSRDIWADYPRKGHSGQSKINMKVIEEEYIWYIWKTARKLMCWSRVNHTASGKRLNQRRSKRHVNLWSFGPLPRYWLLPWVRWTAHISSEMTTENLEQKSHIVWLIY